MLDEELSANPHYRRAGLSGSSRRIVFLDKDAFSRYLEHCRRRGQRMGDVKPLALSPLSGWKEHSRETAADTKVREPPAGPAERPSPLGGGGLEQGGGQEGGGSEVSKAD